MSRGGAKEVGGDGSSRNLIRDCKETVQFKQGLWVLGDFHLMCCGLKMGTKRAPASAGVTVAFRVSIKEGKTNVEKEVDKSTGEEGEV
jgi:hypothetical protein